jgi:hypothetical protein
MSSVGILSDFNDIWSFTLMKVPSIKFHENPSSASRADVGGQMDVTKVIDAFPDYANAPKNSTFCPHSIFVQTAAILLYNP